MIRSKKGVAPLIATGMLIALAIGLGIVVMNFGRAQIEIAAQCAVDIGLQFVELNDKPQVCFNRAENQLFFLAENGPQIDVNALRMRVIGSEKILVQDVDGSQIERTGALLKNIPYNVAEFGDARQLRLTPQITLYDEDILCAEQSIIFDEIRDCQT